MMVGESSSDSPNVEVVSLSSGGMILTEVKAYRALQAIKQCHSFDSIMIEELLGQIRKRNNIPGSYKLHAPRLEQHRYDLFPNGFGLSINVLEVLEANPPAGGDAHPKKMSKLGVCKVSKSTIAWEAAMRGGSSQRWVKSPKPSGQGACLTIWSQPCYEEGYSPKVDEGPNHRYTMALIDQVHDAGRVIDYMGDKIFDLQSEIRELKEGPCMTVIMAAKQRATDLQAEVERLKSDIGEAER
ncbi:hypothetical protein B296_00002222 [Ensete ventricosum]|uniref:Uncharacterized protein n=1 Tax=Ensete ventricosum TaxID=4639 RepID=A0A427AXC9_ENSVE|nr:hypothetical protein B296_00002222 [Ensete ventricosum]